LQENTVNAIHVRRHIDSELVNAIPELREFIGQDAEIIVRADGSHEDDETLETFLGDALHRPPPTPEEMAELRAMADADPFVAAALRMAERGGLDVDTILAVRNAR
jgi:hypothetical protein